MDKLHPYQHEALKTLDLITSSQLEDIRTLARHLADSLKIGGVLHLFGTGHSCLVAIEAFHRAGGLVPVKPILDTRLLPFPTPSECREYERSTGLASEILAAQDVRKGEVIIILSNSGINAVPVEMALEAKERGLYVVAITSRTHSENTPSRHESGQRLLDVAHLVLDSQVPKGDASVVLDESTGMKVCALSGLAGIFLYNLILHETTKLLSDSGERVPVLISNNVEGGEAHNSDLEKAYKDRLQF